MPTAEIYLSSILYNGPNGFEVEFDIHTEGCTDSSGSSFGCELVTEIEDGESVIEESFFVHISGWSVGESGDESFTIRRRGSLPNNGRLIDVINIDSPNFSCFDNRLSLATIEEEKLNQKLFYLQKFSENSTGSNKSEKEKQREEEKAILKNERKDVSQKFDASQNLILLSRKVDDIQRNTNTILKLVQSLPLKIEKIIDEAFHKEIVSETFSNIYSVNKLSASIPEDYTKVSEFIADKLLDSALKLKFYFNRATEYGNSSYFICGRTALLALNCLKVASVKHNELKSTFDEFKKDADIYFSKLVDSNVAGSFLNSVNVQNGIVITARVELDKYIYNQRFLIGYQVFMHFPFKNRGCPS